MSLFDQLLDVTAQAGWKQAAKQFAEVTAPQRREYALRRAVDWRTADFRFVQPGPQDGVALNIGSDWGTISLALAQTYRQVYALDWQAPTRQFGELRMAQENAGNITHLDATSPSIPLPDESVDSVILVDGLEWAASEGEHPATAQRRLLAEAWRVLKPGGWLHLGIENRYGYFYWLGVRDLHTGLRFVTLLPRPVARLYSRLTRGADYQEWVPSWWELRRLVQRAGFGQLQWFWQLPGYRDFRYTVPVEDRAQLQRVVRRMGADSQERRWQKRLLPLISRLRLERLLLPRFCLFARKVEGIE